MMNVPRHAFSLLVTCLAMSSAMAQESDRYALLIGVTKYRHAEMNKPLLAYPEIDAADLGKFLEAHGYEVEYLLGPKATKQAIEAKLDGLGAKGRDGGVCLIGLWGHGVELDGSDEAMFCPYDASIRRAVDSAGNKIFDRNGNPLVEPNPNSLVGMSSVLGGLRIAGASNRLLIADCCRISPNRPRGRAFGSKVKLSDLPDNTAAIFACEQGEQAFEDKRWGHGAMTKALLDLLPGLVSRRDTSVTSLLSPLKRDVADLVRDASKGRDSQTIHPIFKGLPDLKLVKSGGSLDLQPRPEMQTRPTDSADSSMQDFINNKIGMKLKLIPAGTFRMGSPKSEELRDDDEGPQHRVTISKPFYMGIHEVTQSQWESVMRTTPWRGSRSVKEGDHVAVTYVSWEDAVEFCRRLSVREGRTYRLPTEAEWEYACRAWSTTVFHFGDSDTKLSDYAWWGGIAGNGNAQDEQYAHEVGLKRPNAFGLYDMHGNVWEWCSDGKREYTMRSVTDPIGPSGSVSSRVLRGGSWSYAAYYARSADRLSNASDVRISYVGFRVVCE
ncbi:MAG: SUMF1/EgtB/PvdO family nonheme iron enzyme [Planctomycetaceae bacterium]|nr:SUMF1/EgtB/PvdO family nonheme iron enzyme [Planctomycetaceae bacterium]